jgi:hypothetical protein
MTKKVLVVGVAVAVLLGVGGAAFAYFSSPGSGTGSAAVGTASGLIINQSGISAYNSRVAPSLYDWSQCWTCVNANEIGEEINLAGGGGQLNNVVVDMANFDTTPGIESFTLNIYDAAVGDLPGALLATDTQSFPVPATSTGYNGKPPTYGIAPFSVTFDNFTYTADDYSTYGGTLPGKVVYGITPNITPTTEPGAGVNVQLSSEAHITAGSDAASGTVFVSLGSSGGQDAAPGELTCLTGSTTFAQYSTAAGTNCGWASVPAPWGPNVIPAVQFNMDSTASGLFPGGPAQAINLSVYNPGSADVQLNTLTVSLGTNSGTGDIVTTAGDPSSDVLGCLASWFSINGGGTSATVTFNETVPAGETISLTGNFNISMPADSTDNQNACQGANVGLNFSSN